MTGTNELNALVFAFVRGDDVAGAALSDALREVGFDELAVSYTVAAYRKVRDDVAFRTSWLASLEAAEAAAATPQVDGWWPVKTGCVDQAVVSYQDHKRARNWVATVTTDKAAPGGLARSFWDRGSGSWRVVPSDLKVGDVLEVAADYYSGSGRKSSDRTYIRVAAIEHDLVGYVNCEKP